MQALEDDKDTLEILRVYTDAVVADREDPALFIFINTHMDPGRFLAMELDGIPDQVLEKRLQLNVVSHQLWQWIVSHLGTVFFD